MDVVDEEENWIHPAGVTIYLFTGGNGVELDRAYRFGEELETAIEKAAAGHWIGSGYLFEPGLRDVQFEGNPQKLLEVIKQMMLKLEERPSKDSYLKIYDGQSNQVRTIKIEDL